VIAKYAYTNWIKDESLIDIIVGDVWKTFFDQVWSKFPEHAKDVQDVVKTKVSKLATTEVLEADKDVPESSKRDDQDVGKSDVSKLIATEAIEVDQG
ncbi:hypothetical protein Tco_1148608, partial [Tanacetum coccineum]